MDQGRSLCLLWIFTSLGMGCLLASCVTNYWWQIEEDGDRHGGLWKICFKHGCFYYETFGEYFVNSYERLYAVRSCMVFGIFFMALLSVVGFIGTCENKDYRSIIILLEVIALGFCFTAMALSTSSFNRKVLSFQWSYYLGWVGCGLYVVGVIIYCFLSYRNN